MTAVRTVRLVILFAGLTATGCVERRFVIESNVPNAQVFIDNKQVGAAPAYSSFEYYGYHNFTVVHPGYQTVTQRIRVTAPWYSYPPFDFLTEVLWPFHIEDVRRYQIDLSPAPQSRIDDLIGAADALRQHGWSLQSQTPAAGTPVNPPLIEQPINPPPAPSGPNTPAPIVPPVPPSPSSVIPSVTPQYGPVGGTFLR